MQYPVTCECGKTHQVAGSVAGTKIVCGCNRTVEIPSFAKLKASVGESSLSADFEIEQLIQLGGLPLELDCVLCYQATPHQLTATVVCERKITPNANVKWYEILLAWSVSWVWVMFAYLRRTRDLRSIGEDRFFPLPIRTCERCAEGLRSVPTIRDALLRTPLYSRLFEKYPTASIRLNRN